MSNTSNSNRQSKYAKWPKRFQYTMCVCICVCLCGGEESQIDWDATNKKEKKRGEEITPQAELVYHLLIVVQLSRSPNRDVELSSAQRSAFCRFSLFLFLSLLLCMFTVAIVCALLSIAGDGMRGYEDHLQHFYWQKWQQSLLARQEPCVTIVCYPLHFCYIKLFLRLPLQCFAIIFVFVLFLPLKKSYSLYYILYVLWDGKNVHARERTFAFHHFNALFRPLKPYTDELSSWFGFFL